MHKILVLGSGGREHAIAWKVAQSPKVEHVFVAPGNAGTAQETNCSNVELDILDSQAIVNFVRQQKVLLTIVGPEAPLAAGIVDDLTKQKITVFGPTQQAAQLESSKAYCKQFMIDNQIPTASYATFHDAAQAKAYLQQQTFPQVLKADGLAAGKGVIIAQSLEQANSAVDDMLTSKRFGDAGNTIVIEEFLTGIEASYIVMCDGEDYLPLASSKDHKARDDGDLGPNTGGMGAYSPAPHVTKTIEEKIKQQVIEPALKALAKAGTPYRGFLYAGLMIKDNNIKVLEFNCRLGDPETQPLLFRMKSDLFTLCMAACRNKLAKRKISFDKEPTIGVVMAAGGYPEQYDKGDLILGLDQLSDDEVKVFHAGTKLQENETLTNGGRVLCVTAKAKDLKTAHNKAYAAARQIHWPEVYYRRDIGLIKET